MQRFINPTAGMASVGGEVAVPDESSSTESECEHDNQDVRHGEQEEHPWPYLKSLFEFSMVKNANSTSKSYVFNLINRIIRKDSNLSSLFDCLQPFSEQSPIYKPFDGGTPIG